MLKSVPHNCSVYWGFSFDVSLLERYIDEHRNTKHDWSESQAQLESWLAKSYITGKYGAYSCFFDSLIPEEQKEFCELTQTSEDLLVVYCPKMEELFMEQSELTPEDLRDSFSNYKTTFLELAEKIFPVRRMYCSLDRAIASQFHPGWVVYSES